MYAVGLCLLLGALAGVHAQQFSSCDPLDPSLCMLPFPNNFWLRPEPSTGELRIALQNDTLPLDFTGKGIATTAWDALDGFSIMPSLCTYMHNATLDTVGSGYTIARLWNQADSLLATSATVVIKADTGERVAHWVELDHYSDSLGQWYPRVMQIWPSAALEYSTRYIVAIRGISNGSALVSPSVAFHDLRDNVTTKNWDIEGRRELFADIFDRLQAASVSRSDLQLAWDFTTVSRDLITGRMVAMRDDAFARYAQSPIEYYVDIVTDNYSTSIYRRLQGHFFVPWYLNEGIDWTDNLVRLVVDENDVPIFQNYQPINFTVLIPRSLVENGTSGMVLQYGHGLFGSQDEVQTGYLDDEANEHGYVLGAVDWIGLSEYDEVNVGAMLATDLSNFPIIPDRCSQGMLNALSMMHLMITGLSNDSHCIFNGKSVIDATRTGYFGNSQGGILGAVYMALSTEVTRGVIGVGGGPYGLLLPRSADFETMSTILRLRYPSFYFMPLLGVFQMLWDRLEPSGYVRAISTELLPNTPEHRVLLHYGEGDAQVSWLGMEMISRSCGAVVFESNVQVGNETRFGFSTIPDDATDYTHNVMVGWQWDDVPLTNIPFVNQACNKSTDTHERPRREKTAQDMMYQFLQTGAIVNTCGGPCHNVPVA